MSALVIVTALLFVTELTNVYVRPAEATGNVIAAASTPPTSKILPLSADVKALAETDPSASSLLLMVPSLIKTPSTVTNYKITFN